MNLKKVLIYAVAASVSAVSLYSSGVQDSASYKKKREAVDAEFGRMKPSVFSQWAPGVKSRIDTAEKIVVITLDACGGKKGNGYDRELLDFLRSEKIPAALFLTAIWIDANPELTRELSRDPLFEIENHGYRHKPASVKGSVIYGRRGTASAGDLFDEIELNARKIESITGRRPVFYRPGTAYFDDVAVKISYRLGHTPMNFSVVSGDAAGYSAERIEKRLLASTKSGSVIIAHMNHPGKKLYPAMKSSILKLKSMGYRFVKLSEYRERLK